MPRSPQRSKRSGDTHNEEGISKKKATIPTLLTQPLDGEKLPYVPLESKPVQKQTSSPKVDPKSSFAAALKENKKNAPSPSSLSTAGMGSSSPSSHKIHSMVLATGEAILFGVDRRRHEEPCYLKFFIDALLSNEKLQRQTAKIDAILRKRDKSDPHAYWRLQKQKDDGTTYDLLWYYYVRLPDQGCDDVPLEIRKLWGQSVVKLMNALAVKEAKRLPKTRQYRPNTYHYVGDIPLADSDKAHLRAGDIFSIFDTMQSLILPRLGHDSAVHACNSDVVLEHYYGKPSVENVKDFFAPNRNAEDQDSMEHEEDDDYEKYHEDFCSP